jgi:hypothetical protein
LEAAFSSVLSPSFEAGLSVLGSPVAGVPSLAGASAGVSVRRMEETRDFWMVALIVIIKACFDALSLGDNQKRGDTQTLRAFRALREVSLGSKI